MDDAVVAWHVDREGRSTSEVIHLSDNRVIDKGLAELALVLETLAVERRQVRGDLRCGIPTRHDMVLQHVGRDWLAIGCKGRVRRCKHSEWTGAPECVREASGLDGAHERIEVIVALEFILFLTDHDTFRTPDYAWALERGSRANNVGSERRGGSKGCGCGGT